LSLIGADNLFPQIAQISQIIFKFKHSVFFFFFFFFFFFNLCNLRNLLIIFLFLPLIFADSHFGRGDAGAFVALFR